MSLEDLRAAALSDEKDLMVQSAYAERLAQAGKGEEAIGVYERAASLLPEGDTSGHARRLISESAHAAARYGTEEQAESLVARSTGIAPNESNTLLARGILAARKKDFASARDFFEQATHRAPNSAEAWNRLGTALLALQQPRLAEAPLRHAVQLSPNEAGPHADLGEALAQASRYREAQAEYLAAAKIAPSSAAYAAQYALASASAARSDEDFQMASTLLTTAMQQTPDDVALPLTLAGLQMRFARMDEARKTYESVVAKLPEHTDAWFNLSTVYERLGDRASAKIARAKFQELLDRQTAVVELTKRSLKSPEDAAIHASLSEAHRRAGDNEAAYRELKQACKLAPSNANWRAQLDAATRAMSSTTPNSSRTN